MYYDCSFYNTVAGQRRTAKSNDHGVNPATREELWDGRFWFPLKADKCSVDKD